MHHIYSSNGMALLQHPPPINSIRISASPNHGFIPVHFFPCVYPPPSLQCVSSHNPRVYPPSPCVLLRLISRFETHSVTDDVSHPPSPTPAVFLPWHQDDRTIYVSGFSLTVLSSPFSWPLPERNTFHHLIPKNDQ